MCELALRPHIDPEVEEAAWWDDWKLIDGVFFQLLYPVGLDPAPSSVGHKRLLAKALPEPDFR